MFHTERVGSPDLTRHLWSRGTSRWWVLAGVGSRTLIYGVVFLDYIKIISKPNHTSGAINRTPWQASSLAERSLFQSQKIIITKARQGTTEVHTVSLPVSKHDSCV